MGRRGSKDRGQRDDISPSLAELLAPLDDPVRPIRPVTLIPPTSLFHEVEDGRRWSPYGVDRSSVSFSGAEAERRKVVGPARGNPAHAIGFNNPETVVRCARRKARREVIFAKRHRHKGAGSRRRRNFWSNVQC